MLNYSELKDETVKMVQRSTDDTDYLAKAGTWVNFAQNFLYDSYDYYQELFDEHSFTTVDGTEEYYMPNRFGIPLRIYDLTNDSRLTILTREDYFDGHVSNIGDSDEAEAPQFAMLSGVKGIKSTISSSGITLQAKSSSASDTSVVVRVEGYIDSARTILDFEDITVTGTSATTASSPKTFYDIVHVSKSKDSVGYITLEDSSGTDLAILTSIDRVLFHPILKIGLIPGQANSMKVLFKRRINKLVNDNDYPFIDADEFIIAYAAGYGRLQEKESMELSEQLFTQADEAYVRLRTRVNNQLGSDYEQRIVSPLMSSHRS